MPRRLASTSSEKEMEEVKEVNSSMEEEETMANISSSDDNHEEEEEEEEETEPIQQRKRRTNPAALTASTPQPAAAPATSPSEPSSSSTSSATSPPSSATSSPASIPSSSTSPAPRLMIQKLVLENFKSYAGVREIGPFHKSFSSIVGPNGSGKSNVIDALLFVFGYRANQIRLKKLSELIHKSATHPNLTHCSVTVHFQVIVDAPDCSTDSTSDDSYTVLANSAFSLTRSANKSSTSTYYLDGRVVPYSTVCSLLKQHHVDLDNNRFLILQGEVEQIAMMKPKGAAEGESGMLEYLEDIIGSNKYVAALQSMEKELEAMGEERQEKVNRLKLVEKEREALTGPRDEGLAWMVKQQQVMAAKGQLIQMQHYECWLEGGRVREDRARLEEDWKEDKAAMRATEDRLRSLEADMAAAQKEHTAVEAELKRSKAEYAAAERKDIKYKEDIKHRRQKLKKTNTKLQSTLRDISALQQRTADEQTKLPILQQQLTTLTADKERVDSEVSAMYERMKAVMEPFKAELEAKQRQLVPGRKKVNEQQAMVDVVANEMTAIEERRAAVESEVQSLTQQLRGLEDEQRSKADEKKQTSLTVAGLVSSLAKLSASIAGLQHEEAELNKRHSALIADSEDIRVSQSAAASSNTTALAGLMELKRKGQLPSLVGRLGDLAIIDAKYDVAVTTACGALNDIVVEREEDARRAIEWLKREKRGRCKFIILDKMSKLSQEMQQPFQPVDGAQRLFDLLQLEAGRDNVRVAFWYGLRNTLVCDSMDDAMRVGFDRSKRRRVVTLDGKMIDSSGTMTGGGNAVSRGGMRSTWTTKVQQRRGEKGDEVRGEKEIRAMEAEVKDIEAKLASLLTQRKTLTQQQKEQQSEKVKQETVLRRIERECEQIALQAKGLNERLISLKAAAAGREEDNKQLRTLRAKRADSEKAVVKAKNECRGLEEEIANIEQRIMDRGGRVMQDKKTALATLSQQCEEVQAEIVSIEANREGVDRKMRKWQKEQAEAEADEQRTQSEVRELISAQQQLEEDAMAMLAAYKAAQDAEREKEERMSAVRAEHSRGQDELDGWKEKNQERELKAEELEALRKDQEVRERVYKRKLRELMQTMKKERDEAQAAGAIQEETAEQGEDEKKMQVEEVQSWQPQSAEGEEEEEEEQLPVRRGGRGGRRGAATAKPKKGSKSTTSSTSRSSSSAVISQEDSEVSAEEIQTFRLLPLTQLPSNDHRTLTTTLATLQAQLSALQPNPRAILEYNGKDNDYRTRQSDLNDLTARRADSQRAYESTRTQRLNSFMVGFSVIAGKLKEMYQMLTLGGDAELELVDSVDPFAEGISFSVRPPKKSWKNITNLSGGEKTLSSLALVFALHYYRPTPIYVMDEIDAALDFRNVSIVANYIKERTRDSAQFIIVSLRNNMFELADRLVGIYKVRDQTNTVTIDPARFTVPNGRGAEGERSGKGKGEKGENAGKGRGKEEANEMRPSRGPLKPIN